MLSMSVPWWEFILRAVVIYSFLLILLRLTGKRQIGQMSPFDLVLLLVLSNAVQNSLNAGDNSLIGGMISALALMFLNYGFGYLTYRSRKAESTVEGQPELLIHNGRIRMKTLEDEMMTKEELMAALRRQGVADINEVRFAILENNGGISVIKKSDSK